MNSSLFAQNPPIKYDHEDPDINCSKLCQEHEMNSFDTVLSIGRTNALRGLKKKNDVCINETYEQALYSIDNMDDKEKALNCCIFIKFCNESSEEKHLLYLLTWESKYSDYCGSPFMNFDIYRDDCSLI